MTETQALIVAFIVFALSVAIFIMVLNMMAMDARICKLEAQNSATGSGTDTAE